MELFLAHQCQHRRNIRDNAAVIIILFSESLCVQELKVHKKQWDHTLKKHDNHLRYT